MSLIFLDDMPLYGDGDIQQICNAHGVPEAARLTLWHKLEAEGRSLIDRKKLYGQRSQLSRVRRDLRQSRQLAAQLCANAPQPGQISADQASATVCRYQLAALREGVRRLGVSAPVSSQVDEVQRSLDWLIRLYDQALAACHELDKDPEHTWRKTLGEFYGLLMSDTPNQLDHDRVEAFLADCSVRLELGGILIRSDTQRVKRSRK